jgi:hypothetical protein
MGQHQATLFDEPDPVWGDRLNRSAARGAGVFCDPQLHAEEKPRLEVLVPIGPAAATAPPTTPEA